MKQIILHTKYISRFERFLREIEKTGSVQVWRGEQGQAAITWRLRNNDYILGKLLNQLETTAMLENPVYRCSPKLRGIARRFLPLRLHEGDGIRLRAFVKGAKIMHLEGYVGFRMTEYSEALDLLAYRLIKKLDLAQKCQDS